MALRGLTRRPRAVLLDALGTLVELDPPAPALRSELTTRFGLTISPAQAAEAIGAEITFYRAHLWQGRDAASVAELRAACADVLSRKLQAILGRTAPAGPEMVDALLASLRFSAFADAHPALSELRGAGLRLVVVSNWDVSLTEVLERLGLHDCLDGVITSAAVGVAKPDPGIFEEGLAAAGVGPGEAVHVGDSLREDVEGARAAGIEPVLVRRGEAGGPAPGPASGPEPEQETLTVRTLLELPRLTSTASG